MYKVTWKRGAGEKPSFQRRFSPRKLTMILNSHDTCIAYRCPCCGSGVKSVVGIFSLSGAVKRLKCPCGHSSADVESGRDGKIRIKVPCMFCHGEHTFTVSKQVFFDRRIVSFACPNTGMDVLFVGGLEEVEKALDENEKEIVRILKESGIDGYESFASVFGIDPDEDFEPYRPDNEEDEQDGDDRRHDADPVLFDAVMFGIKSLLEEGQVECLCPPIEECASEDEMPDYDIAVSDDHVKLFCRRCGASVDLPIDDPSFARRFLEADHLKLTR